MKFIRTISFQIWFPFSLCLVLLVGFIAYYYPKKLNELNLKTKQLELKQLAETVALGVELSLNSDDYAGLKKTIDFAASKHDFDFVAVVVHDDNGVQNEILASYPPDIELDKVLQKDTVAFIYESAPIHSNNLNGDIVLRYSNSQMREIVEKIEAPAYWTLFIFGLLSLVAFYFFARSISNPIQKLISFTNQMSSGLYEVKPNFKRKTDELGDLTQAILLLQQSLITTQKRNNELTEGLENEIKIRTEELERLSLVAKTTTNSVIITDENKKIQWVNDSLLKLSGYERDEIIGQSPSIFQFEKTDPATKDYIRKCLANKEPVSTEILNRGKFGNEYWLVLNIVPLINAEGNLYGYIAIETDITDKKKFEEEQKLLFDLTHNQNARLKNFAHIVSHNLRSHSANIQVLSKILPTKYPELASDEITQHIQTSSENLLETVDHLSEVALMITNKLGHLEVISLKSIVDKSIVSIAAIAEGAGVTIVNEVSKESYILGLSAYVESITLNLLTNAIKYSDPNKVERKVRLTTEKTEEYVVLCVEDNGIGIDLTKHGRKIFGMYKTFHNHPEARGIGLFMSKNQVEAIGGNIEIISKEGLGTTFKIYFQYE